jgi:hypothetical protein
MTAAHPLDLAWATLTPHEQRMHAAAEARAYYRRPCREWHNAPRDEAVAALVDAIAAVDEAVDSVCPPLPGRPKRDER